MNQKSMRIGIPLRNITRGGVTRFILSLIRDLEKRSDVEVILFCDEAAHELKFDKATSILVPTKSKSRFTRLFWDLFWFNEVALKSTIDVMLYPNGVIPFTQRKTPFKKVNVVHDLTYFSKDFNEYPLMDGLYMKLFMGSSCRAADWIGADSQATKNDLMSLLKIPGEKIDVVYLAPDAGFLNRPSPEEVQTQLQTHGIRQPYLFYCGSLTPRKNMLRMLQAFDKVKDRIPHHFYITSGQSWKDEAVRDYITQNLKDRVTLLKGIDDRLLKALYCSTDLYCYPSLHEGFGLPIVEAQLFGTPVLTSNRTSCPEVAGQGAEVIQEPESVDALAEGLLKVVTNKAYRDELIRKGHENTARFSTQKTCDDYYRIFCRVLKRTPQI